MILTDSEVASLKAAIRWWEWFGYASTAVVGLGCIGEFIAEFTSVSKDEKRKHKLSRLSLIVLIFGIAGELLSAVRTSNVSGELIASIEERAGDAEQKAAEANDRASANEKEAAQLRKDAESERLARVKIEARVAWRHLTERQKAEIGARLSHFSKQGVSVWYEGIDIECSMFAADIAEALLAAHTSYVKPPGGVLTMQNAGRLGQPVTRMETGVIVQSTNDGASRSLAEAIIRELSVRGFDAARPKDPPFDKNPVPQVWVEVKPRPNRPQGEFKLQAEREANNNGSAK